MGYHSPQETIEKLYNFIKDNGITKFSEDELLNYLRKISKPNEKVSRDYVKRLITILNDVGILEKIDDELYEIEKFLPYKEVESIKKEVASKRRRYKSIKSIVGILRMMIDSGNDTYKSRNDPTVSTALELELLKRQGGKLIINSELVNAYSSVIYVREETPRLFEEYKAVRNGIPIEDESINRLKKKGLIDKNGNVIPINLDAILLQDI